MKKFSELIEKQNEVLKGRFKITKSDDDRRLAFGWASVSIRADGELIEDWQGDIIAPCELEEAAYEYVRLYGEGGEMHERGGVAILIDDRYFPTGEGDVFAADKDIATHARNSLPSNSLRQRQR